jgi:type IV pilus assembly protein PilQ
MRRAAASLFIAIFLLAGSTPALSASEASRKRPARLKTAAAKPADRESRYLGEPISLDLKDADLKDVLRTFAELTKINIAVDPDVRGSVTVVLNDVPWDQALELILQMNGFGYMLEGRILRVGKPENLLPRD